MIVDDHAVLRAALRLIIDGQPGMRVVGEAATREEALQFAAVERPDILLLDLDLGDESRFDLVPEIARIAPESSVILLNGLGDPCRGRLWTSAPRKSSSIRSRYEQACRKTPRSKSGQFMCLRIIWTRSSYSPRKSKS